MNRFGALVVSGLVALLAPDAARAGDHNPPPWRGLPNSTTQGWSFVNPGPTGGINPLPDPGVAPFHNPYTYPGMPFPGPQVIGAATWTGATPAGPGFGAAFLSGGAFMDFFIPNNFDPTTHKEIWIQLKFWGQTPTFEILGFDANGNFMGNAQPATSGPIFDVIPGSIPNSSELTIRFEFPFNPAWEIIRIRNSSTGQPLFLYQVVIDTICPTPGTAVAGLMGVGLLASRRRR